MLAKIEIEDQEKLVKLKKVMDILLDTTAQVLRYEAQTVPNMTPEIARHQITRSPINPPLELVSKSKWLNSSQSMSHPIYQTYESAPVNIGGEVFNHQNLLLQSSKENAPML